MPYRAELKRPDLKGQFPCSVCGKIFCHSSSLSRHRMQAHFKSYTCTMCNQEISSNETLRSHMFRQHQISRMFMCRCCNWAFPDKTSLHIHMQSMVRNGEPGDVHILAKSQTIGEGIFPNVTGKLEDMEGISFGDEGDSPDFTDVGDGGASPTTVASMAAMPPTSMAGIFPPPPLPSKEELLSRFKNKNGASKRSSSGGGTGPSNTPNKGSIGNGGTTFGAGAPSPASLLNAAAMMGQSAGAGPGALADSQSLLASWLANNFPNPFVQLAALQRQQQQHPMIGAPASMMQLCNGSATANNNNNQNNVSVNLGLSHNGQTSLIVDDREDDLVVDNLEETMEEGQLQIDETDGAVQTSSPHAAADSATPTAATPGQTSPKQTTDDEMANVNRSAISANPLNSLMYRKKLNNALRSKRGREGRANEPVNNFFYNNNNNNNDSDNNANNPSEMGTKDVKPEEIKSEGHIHHPHHHSPTALSDSQTSTGGGPTSASASETSSTSPIKCFECQVMKGKLSMAENQNRFLESKVGSLENKISRMENQVTSLESTSKRYETEHKNLRQQCEVLERKLLACQEKALKYLENGLLGQSDTGGVKKLLEDLLETTSLLHGAHN